MENSIITIVHYERVIPDSLYSLLRKVTECLEVRILRTGVQPTLDPYAEAFL